MKTISVIICTYNDSEGLKGALDGLLKQECGGSFSFEVIVVDNNSSDSTKQIVEDYIGKFGEKLKYLFESKQGKSFALNLGVSNALGEILAFLDSDVIPDSRWLVSIVEGFNNFDCDVIQGKVKLDLPKNTPLWLSKRFQCTLGRFDGEGDIPKIWHGGLLGGNMAIKKSFFQGNSFFNTQLGPGRSGFYEDSEISRRLRKAGKIQLYFPKVIAYHRVSSNRLTKKSFRKSFFFQGVSEFLLEKNTLPIARNIVYLSKEIAKNVLKIIKSYLDGNVEEQFWNECKICFKLGYLKILIENRKTNS